MHNIERATTPTSVMHLVWRKSTASGNCLELAELPDGDIAVRNSRYPAGASLVYTRAEIAAFVRGARSGEFDDLLI